MTDLSRYAEQALVDLGGSPPDAEESPEQPVTETADVQTSAHAAFVRTLGRTPDQERHRALIKLREAERIVERKRAKLKHAPDGPRRGGLSPRDRAELNLEAAEAAVDHWREAAGLDSGAYFPSDHVGDAGGHSCDGCGRALRDARAYARGFGQCSTCDPFHEDNLTTSPNDPNRPERSHL